MFKFELHFNNASAGYKVGVENISDKVDLKKLEVEWKEKDPGMDDLKGYGEFIQERVQQAEGIELPPV